MLQLLHLFDAPLAASPRALVARRILMVAVLAVSASMAPRLAAQLPPSPLPLGNTEDARTLPKGTVRLRAINAWTRFDAGYGALGDSARRSRPLGEALSATDLGPTQLPILLPAQNALRTLTGNAALALNVGHLVGTANSRIYTTAITLDYGLTDHLTLGAMVPIVQTHSTVFVELNPAAAANSANVGPNPALAPSNAAALQTNRGVYDALTHALTDLNNALATCGSDPTSTVCSRQQEARDARDLSASFAAAVRALYGIDLQSGSPFVPLAAVQAGIAMRLGALDETLSSLLGRAYLNGAAPVGASATAALLQLQQLVTDPAGIALDSLGSPDRVGIGDVELGAMYRLTDGFRDTLNNGVRYRAAVRAVLRLGTGSPTTGLVPFEIGTGAGQTSADGAALIDVRSGRVVATVAGQYTAYLGTATLPRALNDNFALFPLDVPQSGSWRAGNVLQLEATPRVLVTDYFTLHGHYVLRRQAAATALDATGGSHPLIDASTEQRVGLGFAYSTLARYARGRSSVPLELFFSHLETLAARGGLTPKYTREQIEFRIYYRLRRGAR